MNREDVKFWAAFVLGLILFAGAVFGIVAAARYHDLKQADKSCVLQGGHAERVGSHYFLCLDDNGKVVGRP